ncbi:thioredoxin family protein [Alienimonas californiensis]|uniref:Thiol-disulfide oxidoreductase n=1 Tax=Alienimonas californiensis TaxID=2527989 RepID=A0A517P603_9PLAN|nr:thioredoxin family protein [Alienimonas californiensis]QDT14810.1 thiol-disulfide oxidoreductase [Alienimonas californiensis]
MHCRPALVRSLAPLLALTLGVVSVGSADASEFNQVLDVGDKAPAFEKLPTADGKTLSLADLKDKKAVVIVFTCNHCPVAKAYEGRMKAFAEEYGKKGVALVALSVSQEPEDELSQMTARAKEQGFNFAYARDESQAVGKAYGATVTPQTFVLGPDRKVRYMGAWDDSWREAKTAEEHYVRDAVDAVLAGAEPAISEKRQVGCGIVYE